MHCNNNLSPILFSNPSSGMQLVGFLERLFRPSFDFFIFIPCSKFKKSGGDMKCSRNQDLIFEIILVAIFNLIRDFDMFRHCTRSCTTDIYVFNFICEKIGNSSVGESVSLSRFPAFEVEISWSRF